MWAAKFCKRIRSRSKCAGGLVVSLKDESEPISDDEWLVRRVRYDRFRDHKTPYVSPGAFEPRTGGSQPDEEGISLYRLSCLGSVQPILDFIADPVKQSEAGFVQVNVGELLTIGLTTQRDKDDNVKGHVVIPELSAPAFRDAKGARKLCREKMMQLAELASRPEAILRDPSKLPSDHPQ